MSLPGAAFDDDELERRCRGRRWETPLRALGLACVPAAGVAVTLAVSATVGGVLHLSAAVFGVLAAVGVGVALEALWRALPPQRARRERAFRRWCGGRRAPRPLRGGELARWTSRMLDENPALDWLLVLEGRGLPRGLAVSVKAGIGKDPGAFVISSAVRWDRSISEDDSPGRQRALSAAHVAELKRLIADFPDGFRSRPRWEVKDGFPCDVVIARREPPSVVTCQLNQAARDKHSEEPAFLLAHLLLDVAVDPEEPSPGGGRTTKCA